MNNEMSPRDYRGGIKQFVKDKGQVIASGAILGGLSVFGMCEASNADNSNRDEYQDLDNTQLVDDSLVLGESYQSLMDRIMEESRKESFQEREMLEDEELDLETHTPTPTLTPTPTATPTPIPPTPTPTSEPYIPPATSEPPSNSGKVLQDGESIWIVLADCETGDGTVGPPFYAQWDYNGPSGFDGGLQFHPDTWNRIGTGYDYAWQAPPDVQIAAAQKWLEMTDWYQWPACYAEMRAAGYLE